MKTCSKCSLSYSLDEFPNNKKTKDGKGSWCKSCCKLYNNQTKEYKRVKALQYYYQNKEKCNQQQKNSSTKIAPGVYMIKNILTGDFYIGESTQPQKRFWQHCSDKSNNTSKYFLNKKEELIWGIIEHCNPNQLKVKEEYWIKTLKPTLNGAK